VNRQVGSEIPIFNKTGLLLGVLQACNFVKAKPDVSKMLCRMPVVNLPSDLIKDLEKSHSGKIDGTQGPGVANYVASDGTIRADIYVGFEMNGFKLYQNISVVHPNITMQFALKPVISCPSDVLEFKPDRDDSITIQVVVI